MADVLFSINSDTQTSHKTIRIPFQNKNRLTNYAGSSIFNDLTYHKINI